MGPKPSGTRRRTPRWLVGGPAPGGSQLGVQFGEQAENAFSCQHAEINLRSLHVGQRFAVQVHPAALK
jgi:hypothetical protein